MRKWHDRTVKYIYWWSYQIGQWVTAQLNMYICNMYIGNYHLNDESCLGDDS